VASLFHHLLHRNLRSNQSNLMIRKWWGSIFQTLHSLYGGYIPFGPPPRSVNAPMSVINRSIFKILESFCRFSIVLSWFVTDRKPPAVSFFYFLFCRWDVSPHYDQMDWLTAAHIVVIITFLTRPLLFQPIKLLLHKYQVASSNK